MDADLAPFTPQRRAMTAAIAQAHYRHAVVNGQEPGDGFVVAMCVFHTQEGIVETYALEHMPLPDNDNAPRPETRA